jgi:ferredoxin
VSEAGSEVGRDVESIVDVEVDADVCGGVGYCVEVAPQLFALGDGPPAVVRANPLPAGSITAAREAEALCPTHAIRVQAE